MARIPESTLNQLKAKVSLSRLVEAAGITLKPHGKDLIGLCPFHEDHDPSLVITPSKNLWHCLGACQRGGSVIDWVMQIEGVSFRHAVELLLSDYEPAATRAPVKQSTVKKLPVALDTQADDQQLLHHVVTYYHQCLTQSPEALAYAQQRGITANAIDHFQLGFSNRTLGYRLPESNRKTGAALRGQLQRLGVVRDSGHEHFNGSLVIPVINDALVLGMYGRKICDRLRPGTPKHLYLPGPHRGVFNGEVLAHHTEIILCESLIDALTFWCAGYRNVTCSYGIEGFIPELFAALQTHHTQRVLIAYDNDAAGNSAASALSEKLRSEGIDCYRIEFPKGMDANEYALKVGPPSKSLGLAIRKAAWLGKGKPIVLPSTSMTVADETTVEEVQIQTAITIPDDITPSATEQQSIPSLVAHEIADPLPASPLPDPSHDDPVAQCNDDEILLTFGPRRYRVRGLKNNASYDQLKVNVMVSINEGGDVQGRTNTAGAGDARDGGGRIASGTAIGCAGAVHVDTLDLYQARGRQGFIKQAAIELQVDDEVIKKDLAKVLLHLETRQHAQREVLTQPASLELSLTKQEHAHAMELLTAPNLLERILADYQHCGVVGERTNKLVGYLAAVSRKLDKPLAVIIQSTSAAGKSALMEAVLAFMPEEERVQYSAMTGQSLFYLGESNLKHKILAISEEEGAHQAAYALKLLQSEGQLTIASTGKDPDSGKHVTHEYKVEGPVMIFSTTTAIDIDEELLNRCLVLTVDEDRAQTQAIHDWQRYEETLEGLLASQQREDILRVHRNAQRLLKPLKVVNPYAKQLTFMDDKTRTRRDHKKYLTLIRSIALLHQHQREVKTTFYKGQPLPYIEVTLDDIQTANSLAHEVLGRSLDELPPQTRKLLLHIETMVREACVRGNLAREDYRFSRREVREFSGWGNTQLKLHLQRLEDMEYLLLHRGKRGQQMVYELLYDGQGKSGQRFMMKLIEVDTLKNYHYDPNLSGVNPNLSGSSRPQVGGMSGSSRGAQNTDDPLLNSSLAAIPVFTSKKRDQSDNAHVASCRTSISLAAKH